MNEVFSIRFKNYKCFSEENILSNTGVVNLLIGKNNCGKTSVLDIVEKVLSNKAITNESLNNCIIDIRGTITEEVYNSVYTKYEYIGPFCTQENTLYSLGKPLLNQVCYFPLQNSRYEDPVYAKYSAKNSTIFSKNKWEAIRNQIINRIEKRTVYKISAERDIKAEKREDWTGTIDSNGNGITTLIEKYLHDSKGNYKLIKEDVLQALNAILLGENSYSDIEVLSNNELLEVYLYESDRRIPLSSMGSGLKTIIFVLLTLFLSDEKKTKSLFLFEELENNLHPEIQRRLLNYIYDFIKERDSIAFITSHSHVAINCFYNKVDASLYHIYKKSSGGSIIEPIENDAVKASVLNDLGVMASDIFQTNGILWVEGPSDRAYIKKWLNVKYPDLHENEDYTFLYYGGKNLAHFTANAEQENELINILLTNRNGVIVMDHDENGPNDEIRSTKKRIKDEFESRNMYIWITQGKEIENYLKIDDIKSIYGDEINMVQVEPFEPFKDYISSLEPNFVNQKVAFSQKFIFNGNSLKIMDLEKRIDDIATIIKGWNNK